MFGVRLMVFIFFFLYFFPAFLLAAPITFNTALPVSQESWILRQQFIYKQGDSSNKEFKQLQSVSVMGYGVTEDLNLFGVIPFVNSSLDISGGANRDTSGLGDIRLMGRYTVYKHDFKGGTFRAAPFVGLELPTGEDEARDASGLLPHTLQPGSGSWDHFAGIVASYATIDLNIDAQLYWQRNNEANGIERGDMLKADLSLQPRLLPTQVTASTTGFLYGALELNFEHNDKTFVAGVADDNSGGARIFVTPGLQYASSRWVVEAAVQIPVFQNLNGTNIEQDYRVFTGLRINF